MIVDLVRVSTRDGMRLDGAFQPALQSVIPSLNLDAVCFLHGTGGNFYGSTLFDALADCFRELGCGVLRANTRGHDVMSVAPLTAGGGRMQGAAYEAMSDCVHDVAAWMDWLRQRVGARIALLGHSSGAVKAFYAATQEPKLKPACVVAVSPPHLSYSWFCQSTKREEFLKLFQQADRLVNEGQADALMQVTFPLRTVITAAGYVEKYGPDERYNYLKFVDGVRCPALVTLGEQEVADNVAFQESTDVLQELADEKQLLSWTLIAGADHFYTDTRDALQTEVANWLHHHLGNGRATPSWQI